MSTPVDPAVDAVVQAQLAGQAQSVTGSDSAGSFDLSQAKADAVDAQALLAQLQELAAKAQAREDAANPVAGPPDNTLRADSNAPGWLHDVLAKIEGRLASLEG